jgi:hypothetical protein
MEEEEYNDSYDENTNNNNSSCSNTEEKEDRILVFARIRPFIENELNLDSSTPLTVDIENNIIKSK